MTRQPGNSIYDYDPDAGLPRSYGAWQTPTSEPVRHRSPYREPEVDEGAGGAWRCGDCGWAWPFAGKPPVGSECDNCGGELVTEPEVDEGGETGREP